MDRFKEPANFTDIVWEGRREQEEKGELLSIFFTSDFCRWRGGGMVSHVLIFLNIKYVKYTRLQRTNLRH